MKRSISWKQSTTAAVAALCLPLAAMGAGSPVGTWKTIDDESGDPKAMVEITEANGELTGRIVELIDPSEPNPVCDACEGERKGQPIDGMEILWGLSREGKSKTEWSGGHILDPESGKIYKARLTLKNEGHTLDVRGYVGISLLGRTQTWYRQGKSGAQ